MTPGDRARYQDRTVRRPRPARYGTVTSYTPGDPATVTLTMDDGGTVGTVAANVTQAPTTAQPCLLCGRPATVSITTRQAHVIHVCSHHALAPDYVLTLAHAQQHRHGREPIHQPPRPGEVLETLAGLAIVENVSPSGAATMRLRNGTTINQTYESLTSNCKKVC